MTGAEEVGYGSGLTHETLSKLLGDKCAAAIVRDLVALDTSPIVSVDGGEDGRSRPRTAGSPPSGGDLNRQYRNSSRARTRGRRAAFTVAGFLAAFLPLNTYWAVGGTWGIAWVLGCAGCTLPLALVRVQEAMVMAGIAVVLARAGLWRAPLPGWIWRLGLWTMAAAFGAVGAQNLLGDNPPKPGSCSPPSP